MVRRVGNQPGRRRQWPDGKENAEAMQITDSEGGQMSTLYTIGYGGRSPQQVAALLKEHGIDVLVDVRASPRSRVPGFNKNTLARHMMSQEIAYHHIEALGNANRNAGPEASVQLVDEPAGLQALRELLALQDVAIMCACRDYRGCHRAYVAQRMSEYKIVHL